MSFKQQCGCQRHEELTSGKEFKIKRLSSRPYSKSDVERLISLGVLSSRATYLCDICASFGQTDNTEKNKRMKYNHIDAVVKDIEQGDLQEDDMRRLAGALGRSQHETFKQQSYDTTKTYKDSIKQFSIDGWVTSKNIIVSGFINELVGAKEGKSKQSVYIAAAIDCLMAATISNCITPLFFIFNIVSYFICGSKLTSSTLSAFTPSGSYTTLKNWLQGQMSNLCSLPSLNDIITYFDNNQVLSRNWRVRYDAKVRLSVITSVIHILTNKLTSLQTQLHLDPHTWLYRTQIQNETIIHRIVQFIKHCSSSFEVYRNKFIIERINKVYEEHSKDGKDFISTLIDNPDLDIPRGPTNDDPHSFLQHNHPDNPPTVVIGEPVMVNPCSYDSVKHVLQSLLNSIVTNTDRKWTIIGCDGLPYILASRLIDNDANLQHILLQPGLGHYEINMVKACFKLLWEVALSDLALLMGYKSIKAQVACKSASDHHKSWQLLQIFLYGTADELITPYILYCKDNNSKPSLSNYYEWLAQVKNSNYLFMQDVVFTYVYALFLFRSGVRRNNSEVLLAARTKFSPLFYGLNMTNYQEIDYRDIKMRLLAPPEIQNYLNENDSFSTSGHKSKGEGGDFVLENKNKSMKSLIPSGVPSEDVWLRACRTFDKLDGVSILTIQYVSLSICKWLHVDDTVQIFDHIYITGLNMLWYMKKCQLERYC